MAAKALLHVLNNGIDIAEMQSFLCRQLKLPADALLGKECRPAALPGVGLGSRGKVIIKIEPKLRLIAPLMQMRDLLTEQKSVMRVEGARGKYSITIKL